MKTIEVSDELYVLLNRVTKDNSTFNDTIMDLLKDNFYNEEFTDEEAKYYNECIKKIENGDFSGTYEINLEDIDEELEKLESKGII